MLTPGGSLELSWPAVAGKWYRASTSTDLQTGTPASDTLATAAGVLCHPLADGPHERLFLRVGIVP